jgi:polyphosphate kinase
LLSFPYQNFNYIIDLLREAAIDPAVKSISINLYRVASQSKIINALINAVRNGKEVTAIVELQARFDEENNIKMANKLQEEGVKVIYGVQGLKVHAKLILINRKEDGGHKLYAHVGTGNFHEKNALVYTDHSLLTCDERITREVEKVFQFFLANFQRGNYRYLMVSPFNTRKRIIDYINQEIFNAKRQHEAYIIIKLNNLIDEEMIDKLYEASCAGVKIKLLIRGTCSVIPGVKGMSENIEAFSVVDRFLEHARVLIFCNDGNEHIYITSADWMPRNLDHRVEVGVPIYDPGVRKQLREVINIQLNCTAKARIIDITQSNRYRFELLKDKNPLRSQMETYRYFARTLQKAVVNSNESDI